MKDGNTQRHLETITDQGLFERLATAVLREVNPRYRLLTHSGVNLEGRTVKSPVDGIAFVAGANPLHMIAVHHTTCKRKDLKTKWLHDPSKVKPRKGAKTTAPPGDIVKTAQLFEEQKREIPNLRMTLILTTNREPSETLVREATVAGDAAGFEEIIIFSRSAIAHFLDYDVKGQWIRSNFLGIKQERLSDELLRELSRSSLENSGLPDDKELWIDRQLDRTLEEAAGRDVVFVVAESGLGKSVACHKRLTAHVESGGFGLVIPHKIIAETLSLEQAVDATLRHLHPSLVPGVGSEACAIASERTPLLMVVEDINKSGQPTALIERLASWSAKGEEREREPRWQILCPVWPRILTILGDKAQKKINKLALKAFSFTPKESATAVRRRRERAGIPITQLDAEAVSLALGHDPLLIALQDPAVKPDPDHVIEEFIKGSLRRLAESRGEFTAGEYRKELRRAAATMLERRCLDPAMTEVAAWFDQMPSTVRMLRHVLHFGEIVCVTVSASGERWAFRHDRVRDWILADAAADLMRRNAMPVAVLEEPYFAEIIGAALVFDNIPPAAVEQTGAANPLALFCAMRNFGEPTNNLHYVILEYARAWLHDKTVHRPSHDNLRWAVRRVLSEYDASYILSLVQGFHQEQNDWWGLRARFRNGDFMAGVELCCRYEPGVTVVGHVELIDHVQRYRGELLVRTLNDLLCHDQLTSGSRSGALRLAGYLGDSTLEDTVKASWLADSARDERLADYLWAGARCCGDDPARLLEPICNSWATLPDSSRNELAAYQIRFAFRDGIPEPAVRYFIKQAETPELRWPITYMLHSIDQPDAVEFVARELAATDDRLEGTEKIWPFADTVRSEWRRRQEKTGRAMSDASRNRLHELWTNKRNGKHLRNRALELWSSTKAKGDIKVLQIISAEDDLQDAALFQRLRRGDREAIAGLIEKLFQDDQGYWWQAGRYIWSDDLTYSLDGALGRRGDRVERIWNFDGGISIDWILPELLMELPTQTAEDLLIKHWDQLSFSSCYMQAALYTATPRLTELIAKAVAKCPDPKSIFKYLAMRFRFKTKGRTGIIRIAQIQALLPYLDHLADSDISYLWETCNSHGWFEFRRQHFDSRLKSSSYKNIYMDDNRAMTKLDDMLAEEHVFWVKNWVEKLLEIGLSIDHVMKVVEKWLDRQTDIKALKMAADVIVHAGQRCHLSILSNHNVVATDQIASIIANACFALKRRSLN